jgi:hypothetical protein
MRDDDRIEIAELNYAVLGWKEVNEALFEPLTWIAPLTAAIHSPMLPSAEQLDLAELHARLVLNRLNADSTEELEFSRSRSSVQVKGIVESTERKDALMAQLRQVPHVSPAIFSVEELKTRKDPASTVSNVTVYSVVGVPSPLEQYFKAQGKTQDVVSQVSQELLDAAASVKQETGAIHDLLQRFASDPDLGEPGKSALNELVRSHAAKLQSALDTEDHVIGNNPLLGGVSHQPAPAEQNSPEALSTSGNHNMALCREFISAGNATPRPGEAIAIDLLGSTQQLRSILQGLSSNSKSSSQSANASAKNR